jgi:hypothetical protein
LFTGSHYCTGTHCFAFERRNSDATARCEPQPGGWGHTHLVHGVPGRNAPAMGAHVQVHSRKTGKSDLALERGNQQTCEFCGTTSYASTVFKLQQPRALVISDLQGKHRPWSRARKLRELNSTRCCAKDRKTDSSPSPRWPSEGLNLCRGSYFSFHAKTPRGASKIHYPWYLSRPRNCKVLFAPSPGLVSLAAAANLTAWLGF